MAVALRYSGVFVGVTGCQVTRAFKIPFLSVGGITTGSTFGVFTSGVGVTGATGTTGAGVTGVGAGAIGVTGACPTSGRDPACISDCTFALFCSAIALLSSTGSVTTGSGVIGVIAGACHATGAFAIGAGERVDFASSIVAFGFVACNSFRLACKSWSFVAISLVVRK